MEKNRFLQQTKKRKNNEGFTLVEVLVAIFIFSLAVMTFVSVFNQGIRGVDSAKKKVTAAYLAEEGIEYLRNMRDTSMLYTASKTDGWNNFVSRLAAAGCDKSDGCYFDDQSLFDLSSDMPIMNIPIETCLGTCPTLSFDKSTSTYGYAVGTNSGFIRKISFKNINNDEIKIISEVIWRQGMNFGTVSFSENISAWIE